MLTSWYYFNNNLTERSLIYPMLKVSPEYPKCPLLKLIFFNTPVTYFLKYFRTKFCEILMSGSQEIGVFSKKLFQIQSQFHLLRTRCI